MRTVFYILASICLPAFAATLYESRGFTEGPCYSQLVSIQCFQEGKDCVVTIFPNSNGSLSFASLDSGELYRQKKDFLGEYFQSTFRLLINKQNGSTALKVISIKPVLTLIAEELRRNENFLAQPVSCSEIKQKRLFL